MTRALAISDTGLRLIKAFEGFRPDDRTLVTGVRVVGYGHRLDADAAPVHMSRADAEEQLLRDLEPVEEIVNHEVHAPLSQGQFDALCSLAFNIGTPAFRASELVRAMNNGRVLDAANGFDVWRKATVNGQAYVVDALMRRRTAEKSLFLRNEPAVPAPSAMLTPQADDGLRHVVMSDAPGVIDGANIINADRVDPVTTPFAPTDAVPPVAVSEASAVDDDDDDAVVALSAIQAVAQSDVRPPALNLVESLLETDAHRFEADANDSFGPEDDDDFDGDDGDDTFDLVDDDDDDTSYGQDDFENDNDGEDEDADYEGEDADNDDDNNDASATIEGTPLTTRLDLDAAVELDPIDVDVDRDADRSDFAALISPVITARETPVAANADDYPDRDYHGAERAQTVSAIASAATTLENRLSALLDGAETAPEDDALKAMPTSLFEPSEGINQPSLAPQPSSVDGSARSQLLSFPKRELVLDQSIDPGPMTLDAAPSETEGLIATDDLAADDAIRARFEPEIRVFDPDGDPAENAARYLERRPSKSGPQKIGVGLWIPIALGAALVGASAVFIGRGASQLITAWGPTAVTAAAITGGLTLLFALYAMARIRFA